MQRNESSLEKHTSPQSKRGVLSEIVPPFVGHNKPFVRCTTPCIRPFICTNKPFICIGANFRLQFGITLIELMITLAIFAIIGAFAMPSFREMLLNTATTTSANEFLTDLNFARSEALKRGVRVEVCIPNAAQTACNYCGTWSGPTGRVVGVNTAAGVFVVIRVREPLSAVRSLGVPAPGRSYTSVSFVNSGLVQFRDCAGIAPAATTAVFGLCHDRDNNGTKDPEVGKNIRIGPTGGIRVSSPATACVP